MTQQSTTLANFLYWLCTVLLVALPITALGYVIMAQPTPDIAADLYPDFKILAPPPATAFWAANAIGLLGVLLIWWLIFRLKALFNAYRKGAALTHRCAELLRSCGHTLLAMAILKLLSHPALTLLLTMGNPEGQRELSIAINDSEIAFLLAAGLISLIGQAMQDAAKNAQEIKEFV